MRILDKLFGKNNETQTNKVASEGQRISFINGYTPAYTTYEGGLYEMALTRSIISSFARNCSKLTPEVIGPNNQVLNRRLKNKMNFLQTTPQFISKVATIYEANNTVFLIPENDLLGKVVGIYPVLPESTELVEYQNKYYLIYSFFGKKRSIEFDRVGIISQHLYKDDFIGESNKAMDTQLELIHSQDEGIIEATKQSGIVRFMAKIGSILKEKDIEAKRQSFAKNNLSKENMGLMLYDQTFEDVKQIESKPYVIDAEQMNSIKKNAYQYFGTNEKILESNFTSDEWNAYYESKIEPFAIQLGIALTNMFFSDKEQGFNNKIVLSSNRMNYLNNSEKVSTVQTLFDRGLLTTNKALEIMNLPPLNEGGDKTYIRKEYMEFNPVETHEEVQDGEENTPDEIGGEKTI